MSNDYFECAQCKQSFHSSTYRSGLCISCYESIEEKRVEYRELVKQYAGQIFAGLCSNSLYDFKDADMMTESIVSKAHALAREVLASLDKEKV